MKILSLSYKNTFEEWGFEDINFFDLTLLVGISGVGKTQILESINALKHVTNGDSFYGIEWDIYFIANNGDTYRWQGSFEKGILQDNLLESLEESPFFEDSNKAKPNIKSEKIFINNNKIPVIHRTNGAIYFNGHKMPKLSPQESCVTIFKAEDAIKPIYESFKKIVFRDHTKKEVLGFSLRDENIAKKYQTLKQIRESDLDTIDKLYCVFENIPSLFNQIKDNFIDVFPQVQNLKMETLKAQNVPSFMLSASILSIKESHVDKWIPQQRISSGMLRTLLHISEMFLWSDGTVILIDEFENSLGVNCIDVLTEDLIFENSRIQFIVTSHHPYIINKIPYDYWKIVTRHGGKIKTYDAHAFDLGDSHHERFMNLINLPQYRQGLTV